MYIHGWLEALGNFAGFINNTWTRTTRQKPNCIFEGHVGNREFVSIMKKIAAWEELLVDYDWNWIDTYDVIVGVIIFY